MRDIFFSIEPLSRPPCYFQQEVDKNGLLVSVLIQYALAGYKEEDVKVYYENSVLFVKGDNTYREANEVSSKFRSDFLHQIPVSKALDLTAAEVTFENGLLSISIPVSRNKQDRIVLF
jgi:HSP20 family molecular chaperone IbpA